MADEVRLIDAEKLKRKLIEGDGHDDDGFTEGYNCAVNDIRGYIDEMPTVEAEPDNGWINVKDRLPENRNQVMVYGLVDSIFQYGVKDEIYIIGRYRKDYHSWWFPVKIDLKVTHWRHLPKPPKGE